MTYQVKELYYTLQGEGAQAGRAAVFLRFAGCNLWSGREADRAKAACDFCDTDFVGLDGPGGGRFGGADELAAAVGALWRAHAGAGGRPYVVCTGGEPLLQLDAALIDKLHAEGLEVAVETNGTIAAPSGLDWICVSPKGANPLVQLSGDELKLVYPQAGVDPARFEGLAFTHFLLQPMDLTARERGARPSGLDTTMAAARYCLEHPLWRLSLQTHKSVGLP